MALTRPLVLLAALLLSGCVTHPLAIPDNEAARTIGVLRVDLVQAGMGAGPFAVYMPDGEVLKGRYSVNLGGSVGFGQLYGSVYGSGGYASGSAFSTSTAFSMSSGAVADAIGPKGTTIHCEVVNGNYTGHGNGVCKLSNGALYRIQY